MRIIQSHGRRILIGTLIAFMAVFWGAALFKHFNRPSETQAQLSLLSHENQLLMTSVQARLAQVRESAVSHLKSPSPSALPSEILSWNELSKLPTGEWQVIRSEPQADGGFHHRLLKELNQTPTILDWKVLFFQADSQRGVDRPVVVIAAEGSWVAIQIDADRVFNEIREFSKAADQTGKRVYLMGPFGNILAHSQPGFLGSNFSGIDIFKTYAKPLIESRSENPISTQAQSFEGYPVLVALAPIPNTPMVGVLEKIQASSEVKTSEIFKWTGKLIALFGAILALFWSFFKAKAPPKKEMTFAPLPEVTPQVEKVKSPQLKPSVRAETQRWIENFEKTLFTLRDPRVVSNTLTRGIAHMTRSPALYFRYDPRLGQAILESDAGFADGQAPASMAFPLPASGVQRIFDCVKDGSLASLNQYPPLSQLMLRRHGVACFEAWALVNRAGLAGVIVILQSNAESTSQREFLARMMKATTVAYETKPTRPSPHQPL